MRELHVHWHELHKVEEQGGVHEQHVGDEGDEQCSDKELAQDRTIWRNLVKVSCAPMAPRDWWCLCTVVVCKVWSPGVGI